MAYRTDQKYLPLADSRCSAWKAVAHRNQKGNMSCYRWPDGRGQAKLADLIFRPGSGQSKGAQGGGKLCQHGIADARATIGLVQGQGLQICEQK
eukprot:scaffold723_cov363-Prasinococcus_capsulatus_cf.AAC.13